MNIKDKLTIVIPSFNEENYIERTITNLANQNNITGTRVIIADGFSRDRTRSKIINLKHSLKDKINISDNREVFILLIIFWLPSSISSELRIVILCSYFLLLLIFNITTIKKYNSRK